MSNPLLSSYGSCFVFTKHPVQLKTVTTNDMFSKYVLFKKGHLNKRAGVWTPWTPPGSATACHRAAQRVLHEEEQLDANAYDTVADRNRKWLS